MINNYTGTHICDRCLEYAITSYVFVSKIRHVRTRLFACVSNMLDQLNELSESDKNLMVEISQYSILPQIEDELKVIELDSDNIDESKFEVDVLEDEFRVESSSSGEDEVKSEHSEFSDNEMDTDKDQDTREFMENPAKKATKTYINKKLLNGYKTAAAENDWLKDVCEFLTFKKKVKRNRRRPYKCKFTCPYCTKHFITDYFLKRHVLKHKLSKVNCKTCGLQFKSKFYLYEHVKMNHLMKETCYSSCSVCGRTFSNMKKMKMHEKSHRIKECLLCDKFFMSQKHYNSHMQRHAIKLNLVKHWRVQTCSFCEKECANENELSLHVNKSHLQIKPYSCDMCDRLFYTEYHLKNHKKIHNLYSNESCEFCDAKFKCRKHLVIHVRKHLGSKPHVCQVCRQGFYSESKMKLHMEVYHGGRFCCRLCKIVTATKSELRTHISVEHSAM